MVGVVSFAEVSDSVATLGGSAGVVRCRQVGGPVRDAGRELRDWRFAVAGMAIIVAISLQDSAAKKAGIFLPD